ncbi:hypothetical protein NBM05_06810 [Rothia sp. AR01]|uniref:Uncharacterized protein n=1 Tax=Rothia santali TaxID=2949643 RepID=A0A9X2HHD4_9MICC|nr:hypothetical protein [Rothia santali]MCP3425731.1 hypothetical protein [Rothia santali]
MSTVLVVTEAILGPTDIENIDAFAPREEDETTEIRLMVPAAMKKNLWLEFLDQLALLDFREAVDVVTSAEKGPQTLESEARAILDASVEELRAQGYSVRGRTAVGDPLAAMQEEVSDGAEQVLIITDPHPVEDTFNIHWSNKAERTLGVPVLHLYWGTGYVDD